MPIHTFRRLFSQQNKASSSNICERQGVFKEVQEADTLRAYVDFVTKYPESDLAKESTKNILSKQLELGVKPSENVGSATESSLGDITKLTPEEISKLPPEQISALSKYCSAME